MSHRGHGGTTEITELYRRFRKVLHELCDSSVFSVTPIEYAHEPAES
jgi:hypothetical protein